MISCPKGKEGSRLNSNREAYPTFKLKTCLFVTTLNAPWCYSVAIDMWQQYPKLSPDC